MKDFLHTKEPNFHIGRKKEIMNKYPEVKNLMGHNPLSALWILGLVVTQFLMAYFLRDQGIWVILLVSYLFGAFVNHALYVQIHECTHNLVFRTSFGNKIMGIVCDFPLLLPSAMGFRKYHMIHHRHLGEYEMDPDVCSHIEAKLVGNGPIRKALWISLFSISQALRPMKLKKVRLMDRWIFSNLFIQILINFLVYFYLGKMSFFYLGLSTFFALGLHPLGGRWIQEHYVTKKGQETYSYYGPLNAVTFNMGFHNEHHDFMNVSWVNLPKLRALAPEYYDSLKSYNSWTAVLWQFIFNKKLSPYSRIVHPDKKAKAL